LLHGGFGQVPLLYGKNLHLTGPRAIVDRFDATATHHLLPSSEPQHAEVEADWARFNGDLATYTARIPYYHLLPNAGIMIPAFKQGIPAWEQGLTEHFYPALRWLFTQLLRLQPQVIADALTRVEIAVTAAEARLADGRLFLIGDNLTLSDLALATAMAPLVLPPAYAARLPALEIMPREMQSLVAQFRNRPIGVYVNRIFALF
jgi:glutathione S-transferase